MSVFMQPIYTANVGAGGTSSVVFNNIPQGFTDLKLVVSSRDGRTSNVWDNILVYFNGSTAGYSSHIAYVIDAAQATNTTVTYGGGISANFGFALYGSTSLNEAGTFCNSELTIPNYSGGAHKHVIGESAIPSNSTSVYQLSFHSGVWKNTAPITSITVAPGTGAFAQYSTFTLYGISAAYAGGAPAAPTLNSVTDEAGFVQVAFTPAANDQASSYAVTSTPSGATTYGSTSPIDTPALLNSSYVYQVAAVNARGSSTSSDSSAITTYNSFVSLATQVVGAGGTSSIVFSDIPQGYSHLQIRAFARSSSGSLQNNISASFNGDTAANYAQHAIYSDGATAGATGQINLSGISFAGYAAGPSAGANMFACNIVDILDYTSISKYKTLKSLSTWDLNGSGYVQYSSGLWMNYSPITSIILSCSNLVQYSHFALYGIA
jgi:hypothetical protein